MDFGTIAIFSLLVGIFFGFFVSFLLKNQESPDTIKQEIRSVVLALCLYAEKQGWQPEKKLAYVIHRIYDYIPGQHLSIVLGERELTSYVQEIYDDLVHNGKIK